MISNIFKVSDWNRDKRTLGQYILVYTLGNGLMVDIPRQRGYVVQKHHTEGGERSKFHINKATAYADLQSDIF